MLFAAAHRPGRARLLAAALLPALCLAVAAADASPDSGVSHPRFAQTPRAGQDKKDDKKPTSMSPTDLDKAIMADIKSNSELMKNLEYLSDVIGPRLTGSKGAEKANKWTADKMREYGLENVKLESWEIPVGWERGRASMVIVEPETSRWLNVASYAWTPGIKGGKVTGEVVILRGRNKDDLKAYKGKLKNAVILTRPPSNPAPITDLTYLGPVPPLPNKADYFTDLPANDEPKKKIEGPKDESRRIDDPFSLRLSPAHFDLQPPKKEEQKNDDKKKDDKKADQPLPPIGQGFGVTSRDLDAFLLEEGAACKLSDSNRPHGLLIMNGRWPRAVPDDQIANLVVATDHYAMLWRLASRPAPFVTKVEVEAQAKFVPGPITVYNTVGEVKGSEKPDEFVVVGAHLDSWDLASGTTDNGTGSCTVLETARVVSALAKKGYPPKRTVRFALFTGEEQGLYGSGEYVKRHKDEMAKTSACLVHDTGTGRVLGWGLQGRGACYQVLEPRLQSLFATDGYRGCDLGGQFGSDHVSFESAGVPGFAVRQERDEYRLTHHTQNDLFERAKPANLSQGAQVVSVTAVRIANLPDLLPRTRGLKVDKIPWPAAQ